MDGPLQRPEEHQRDQAKGPWARPTLTYLGNLRDIVHGFGKTGRKCRLGSSVHREVRDGLVGRPESPLSLSRRR